MWYIYIYSTHHNWVDDIFRFLVTSQTLPSDCDLRVPLHSSAAPHPTGDSYDPRSQKPSGHPRPDTADVVGFFWGKTWENPRFQDGKPIVCCGKQPQNMGKPGVCCLGMKQRLPVNLPSCQLKYVEIVAGKNQWIGWLDSIGNLRFLFNEEDMAVEQLSTELMLRKKQWPIVSPLMVLNT